ncbi:MAG: hypothetical protein C4309_13080 [Chloroflexota bacterium]
MDPDVADLIAFESERQARKLILVASESSAPQAVLEALGSRFQNLYAEGYPNPETRWLTEEEILDYERQLAHYRRYGDPRYYRGVEYVDIAEALAAKGYEIERKRKSRVRSRARPRTTPSMRPCASPATRSWACPWCMAAT